VWPVTSEHVKPTFLSVVSREASQWIHSVSSRRRFKRGEVIFHQGDPGDTVHFINRGHVAIRMTTPVGDVATLAVLGPDEFFGEQALLSPDHRRTATASAVEHAETQSLRREQFDELRLAQPAVDQFLIDMLAGQVRRLSSQLQEALYVSAEKRVLRRTSEMAQSYAGSERPTIIPLTQDDIASMAGTSRPTANRVLKAAEADGLLVVARARIEVADAEMLAARCRW
jgi:CRP/FNR family transcriptional regulator, cyclic AMP receptor protein